MSDSIRSSSPEAIPFRHPRISFGRDIRSVVWRFTSGRCWYCGFVTDPFDDFCIDHVLPVSRGGSNALENLVPCCSYCNSRKRAMLVDEWRAWFDDAEELNEEPWIDPSGVFWFERDAWPECSKRNEINAYRRSRGRRGAV